MRAGAHTAIGNYRETNEDSYFLSDELGLYMVADGMGGQAAGEQASRLTIDLIAQKVAAAATTAPEADPQQSIENTRRLLHDAVVQASREVRARGQNHPELKDMGSTITVALVRPDHVFVTWLGDSRVYRLRGGTMTQLTVDHSLAQALVDAGTIRREEADTHYFRNVLWRFVGADDLGDAPEVAVLDRQPGDRYLLTTDGLTGVVSEVVIASLLALGDDPQVCCQRLVEAALQADSKDNVTCLAIFL